MKRFWNKVAKSGKCWEWVGSDNGTGYCQINLNGKHTYVHRLAYMLTHGEIPKGMCVCHKCDNPRCVRPSHLFLGTQLENIRDKCSKGRHRSAVGERQGGAKLTETQVLEIRKEYSKGKCTQDQLGKEYGVADSIICRIVNRKIWRHI